MAEYYPLLSRAVAGLRDAPPEQRRAIYDRARQALLGQLRSMEPAVPEDAIERESLALDASIDRLEGEIAKGATPAAPAVPPSPAPPSPPGAEKPASAAPTAKATPAPKPAPVTAPVSVAPAPLPAAPKAASVAPAPLPTPKPPASAEKPPIGPAAPLAAPTTTPPKPPPRPTAMLSPTTTRPAAATGTRPPAPTPKPMPPRPTFGPGTRPGAGAAASPAQSAPALRALRIEEPAGATLPTAPRLQVAPVAKEPVVEQPLGPVAGAEPEATPSEPQADQGPVAKDEVLRPAAPRPVLREQFNPRLIIVAAVAVLVIAGISYTAWRLRDRPETLARSRAAMIAAQQAEQQQPAKVITRADGGAAPPPVVAESAPAEKTPAAAPQPAPPPPPAATTSVPPPASAPVSPSTQPQDNAAQPATGTPAGTAPDAPAQSAPATAAPAGSVAATADLQSVPVAQRAALLVDAPDDPKKVKTYVGTVVWRSDSISPGQGQPLTTVVRAEVEVPEADLKLSMLFQKNAEPQFPASHTMELRFTALANNTLGGVKQINVPQMRKDDSPTGDALVGLPVTITENYFLVGLSRGDAVARNLDLIKTRNWFDLPMMLVSGKIAKITFEKGTVGQQIIDNAMQSWQ